MNKIFFPIILLASLAGVLFLTNSFQKSTTHFYGVTDNHEQSVSFQESVKITEIMVIEGQHVEQGTVLLTAKRNELTVQKDQLNNQIDELNARQGESVARLNAEIKVLRAQQRTDLLKIDAQIQQLQAKRQLNLDLYQNITGTSIQQKNTETDPTTQQIQSLRAQRRAIKRAVQAQVSGLKSQIKAGEQPILVQKQQVASRLDEISRQAEALTIRADFTGRIGSITTKQGERVPAFQSVVTVHSLHPEYVKGYIHENVSNDVTIGQQVWIHSIFNNNLNQNGAPLKARVESLGSRIVEYPERLKKNPAIKSWGREVNIRLPMNNPLLLGEKVQISFTPDRPNTMEALFQPFGKKTESLFPSAHANQVKRGE